MLTKRWKLKEVNEKLAHKLQEELKTNLSICKILTQRGLYTYEEAKTFFRPKLDMLHHPFLMKDMDKAVERVIKAIETNETILIYGDYDVDGTTSVALMYLFLYKIHTKIEFYIPDRYSEGYGISLKGIDYAKEQNISLIIALDCGVTAIKQVEYANSFGIDFIICDHHLPSDHLPDAIAVLDPKRNDCQYPFKELSGAGVGFKLCSALALTLEIPNEELFKYLDLVAVSIASDIVPVVGENRILAYYGLEKLNTNPIIGLKVLKTLSNLDSKEISISEVVFSLGPRINAPGRMSHAKASVEMLIAENEEIGFGMAEKLNLVNTERRVTDEQITGEAMYTLDNETELLNKKTIVLTHPDWSKGVIGIVASRLVEKYYRPTIIFSEKDNILTGSARSIKGFSIYEGIKKCSEHIVQFGGHDFAAGVSLHKDNFEAFKNTFELEASKLISEDMLLPEIEIDLELELKDITMSFFNILTQIGPFGPKNMQPVFRTNNLVDAGGTRYVGKDNNHVKFNLKDENGLIVNGIAFGLGKYYDIKDIQSNPLDICYTLNINDFNNKKTLEVSIKDIKIKD